MRSSSLSCGWKRNFSPVSSKSDLNLCAKRFRIRTVIASHFVDQYLVFPDDVSATSTSTKTSGISLVDVDPFYGVVKHK
jgi:hypothetical protein